MSTHGEVAQLQGANRDSLQPRYLVSDCGEDTANFPVSPLGQDHFEDRSGALPFLDRNPFHLGLAFRQVDAAFKLLQLLQGGTADALHKVALFHAEFGMGQAKSQVPVVGDDDQAFAALVQSPDVIDAEVGFDQVDDSGAAVGVFIGRKHSLRLIEHKVLKFLAADPFTVDANLLAFRIDSGPQFRAWLAIDFHSAFGNQCFTIPATSEPSPGEHSLEAEQLVRGGRRGGGRPAGLFVHGRIQLSWQRDIPILVAAVRLLHRCPATIHRIPLRFNQFVTIGRSCSARAVAQGELIMSLTVGVYRRGMLLLVALLTAAAMFQSASGQEWAVKQLEESPRHGEWVVIEHGGRKLDAFVVYPEVKDKALAVVVVHEIFGLTDWVRTVADELAANGYIAIAPDLLSGSGPDGGNTSSFKGGDGARQAIAKLSPDQITADLNASAEYVAKLPACNGKVAVAGFCWGGGQAFRYATNNSGLVAAFPFYGSGPTEAAELERVQCPVYGFYARNDARVNATVEQSEKSMQAAGKTFEPVYYDDAGHGFMRAGQAPDASEGNRAGRAAAWKRWLELLRKSAG